MKELLQLKNLTKNKKRNRIIKDHFKINFSSNINKKKQIIILIIIAMSRKQSKSSNYNNNNKINKLQQQQQEKIQCLTKI